MGDVLNIKQLASEITLHLFGFFKIFSLNVDNLFKLIFMTNGSGLFV